LVAPEATSIRTWRIQANCVLLVDFSWEMDDEEGLLGLLARRELWERPRCVCRLLGVMLCTMHRQ
jgi:hypothetical protein